METVIVYKSKTGFTEQYAKWIAEEIGCDVVSEKMANVESLKNYKNVIYGGGLTAGQVGGLKKFKNVMSKFPEKKFIVFATGATPAEVFEKTDDIRNANFTDEEKHRIPFFYFQSGINYEKMNLGGRLLMKVFTSMLANKKDKTPEEQGQADSMKQSKDYSDRKYIAPLVKYIKGEKR